MSRAEGLCKIAFETCLGRKVIGSYRGNEMRNPLTGCNLELDMFDPESKIAVEYNGIQHYQYPNPFHASRREYKDQKVRDTIKKALCLKNGYKLITVSHIVDKKGVTDDEKLVLFYRHLIRKLKKLN